MEIIRTEKTVDLFDYEMDTYFVYPHSWSDSVIREHHSEIKTLISNCKQLQKNCAILDILNLHWDDWFYQHPDSGHWSAKDPNEWIGTCLKEIIKSKHPALYQSLSETVPTMPVGKSANEYDAIKVHQHLLRLHTALKTISAKLDLIEKAWFYKTDCNQWFARPYPERNNRTQTVQSIKRNYEVTQ